ncbi:MAG: cofactor-independent phosphoglycerate mutase [Bacteroidales bacterium]|nr:cofactor-independent phosphoglycerate mutase [Bacteroidales bacterium]
MKYIIILADGAADEPLELFGGKTPLQAADKPHIDRIAREGINGRLVTVPEGFHPGSEIAHLGLLGYDVAKVFEGRGSLEAASMQVPIDDNEVAMRCNIICLDGENIKNHSAGNISNEEASVLIEYLNNELKDFHSSTRIPTDGIRFFDGVSYRHLLKIKGGKKQVNCTPPHDRIGKPWQPELPVAETSEGEETAQLLRELILWSQEKLKNHPVNLKRIAEGKDPANSIWSWSLGYRPQMQTLQELFPNRIQTGAVISAVDLIFGIGVYCGLKKVEVPGATGLWDTNYEGKCEAALKELREKDFVFLHVEATDEAGHDGEPELKKRCVEMLDQRCVGPILQEVEKWDEAVRVAVLPDHPTPIKYRTHTMTPVPFAIWQNHPSSKASDPTPLPTDSVQTFDEEACFHGALGLLQKDQFIRTFLG